MNDHGARQAPARPAQGDQERRPAATRRGRDGGVHGERRGGAEPVRHRDESFDYFRSAINRTYR